MYEYEGEYGARHTCRQCVNCPVGSNHEYRKCDVQGVNISPANNVCREFEARIKNPSSPEFNLDDYLEFLGSDFYRPWGITEEIIGSSRLGEVKIDGGKLAELAPKSYSPFYKPYDKPFCHTFMPRCRVEYDGNKFEIDYRRYREVRTIEDGTIHFDTRLWKDSPRQHKYQREINGQYLLNESEAI